MTTQIVLLPGDGVGPEVIAAGHAVLEAVSRKYALDLRIESRPFGGAAIDAHGEALPAAVLDACRSADAILLGAIGGPRWNELPLARRPESGLLELRKSLGLYANVRPVRVHPALLDVSPLKAERARDVDLLVVRELTGGIYFGARTRSADRATDECAYTIAEIERVTRVAARMAHARDGRLTSVDKANVLETSRLWRETVTRLMAQEFPAVQLEHLLVDAMAMYLISRPRDFDVVLTENLFGDILSDAAAAVAGSLGLIPSASFGDTAPALYEPIHGSAPDIAGKGVANPYATILSAALLLRHSVEHEIAAGAVENAVHRAIEQGQLTPDIAGVRSAVGTAQATAAVIALLD